MGLGHLVKAAARAFGSKQYRREVFEPEMARVLDVRRVFAVSSGKAALTLALLALAKLSGDRRKVIIPAYTCYSVPSAIVKAGLQVVPCDIAEGSFDYDYARLSSLLGPDVLCVMSVHLFGIPSDTGRLMQLCRETGTFVVEDAAQAFGGVSHGRRLGTVGDIGIFSLGRGKNITCGSGGLIVTSSRPIADALRELTVEMPATSVAHDVATFVTLLVLSLFILPWLYWFPSGLRFLRLGETIFYEDFPVRWMSDFQALLLRGWEQQLLGLDRIRVENSRHYLDALDVMRDQLRESGVRQPARQARGVPLLRFPVLLGGSAETRKALFDLDGRSLGMSIMYPATIARIPQLAGQFADASFPRADAVADRLVTLPTHALVSARDRARVCAVVNECSSRLVEARVAS
jgi:dTDP-4-amino-4,6-dideoxygalactose transaminase